MKIEDDHPAWPWIIEDVAHTLHVFQINRSDGLTAAQRIKGRACSTPRARIGEKLLYKSMKTMKSMN